MTSRMNVDLPLPQCPITAIDNGGMAMAWT
jgi:hypothetical protein